LSPRIIIDVRRSDGDVTRLEGQAGVAICLQGSTPIIDLAAEPRDFMAALANVPVCALRADNLAQLAVMLGSIVATVEAVGGEDCVNYGLMLSSLIDAKRPDQIRKLRDLARGTD